jgi:thymidylate kinase
MIILEGPDGTGKTTLAHTISREWGLEYRRPPTLSSTRGADKAVFSWWKEQIRQDDDVVYDRCFFISEVIYQLARAERPLLISGETFRDGVMDLVNCDPFLIFCLPPWAKTKPVVLSGRDRLEGYDEGALEKIHWAYHAFYALYYSVNPRDVRVWDYTNLDSSRHREQLIISVGTHLKSRLPV